MKTVDIPLKIFGSVLMFLISVVLAIVFGFIKLTELIALCFVNRGDFVEIGFSAGCGGPKPPTIKTIRLTGPADDVPEYDEHGNLKPPLGLSLSYGFRRRNRGRGHNHSD